jgi:hypothetical protein
MNEERAKKAIVKMGQYAVWVKPSTKVILNGEYSPTELEALVWWMKHKEHIGMSAAYNKK